jgi:hypothetical protein
MDQQVLNDAQLIELVRKTANHIETGDKTNKPLILLAEFARELLRQRTLAKVHFPQLFGRRKACCQTYGPIQGNRMGPNPMGVRGDSDVLGLLFPALARLGRRQSEGEETLKNANKVLSDMLSRNAVPAEVLVRANCIVVLPGEKKFGLGVAGTPGRRIGYPFDRYLAIHNSPAGPWKQIFKMSKRQTILLCSDCFSSHFDAC